MKSFALFDLDGTLLDAGRSGRRAFTRALKMLRPDIDLDQVSFAGKTDLGLLSLLMDEEEAHRLLREITQIYPPLLYAELHGERGAGPLPGARELLEAIQNDNSIIPIVQTGNIRMGALLKLKFCGISTFFHHFSSGESAKDRKELLNEAKRVALEIDLHIADHQFIVIGDTKEELLAAKELGFRSLGVETGVTGRRVREAEPDYCFENFSEVPAVLAAITDHSGK